MTLENFFVTRKPQSEVKSKIVSSYFWFWAKVIPGFLKKYNKGNTICYIDLYSGPGIYEDGSKSTPILIMERAISDKVISEHLISVFNDEKKSYIERLEKEINNLKDVSSLKYKSKFLNKNVEEITLADLYTNPRQIPPTLLFADPFGYKGISIGLLACVRHWGSDVIFFFNFHQVNRALENPVMSKNMDDLFGKEYAGKLRLEIESQKEWLDSDDREKIIFDMLGEALRVKIPNLQPILTFKFQDPKADKTNHHIVFLTTSKFAFAKMKDMMAGVSKEDGSTVGSFQFDPKKTKALPPLQLKLFQDEPVNPLDELKTHLLAKFKGQKKSVKDVFYTDQHTNTKFTEQNYKDALRELETEGKVAVNPPSIDRKVMKGKITMPDTAVVDFN